MFNLTSEQLIDFLRGNSGQTLWVILLPAAAFGIFHAFTPGHGKAIIGTYMAAIHGTLKDSFLIALATTLSHTILILFLGLLFAISKEGLTVFFLHIPAFNFDWRSILPSLKIGSAIVIISIGAWMVYSKIKEFREYDAVEQSAEGETLPAVEEHEHSFFAKLSKKLQFKVIDHGSHKHYVPRKKLSLKESLLLGISSGLTPCADAVLIFLTGISLGQAWLSFWLLLAFSVGLGLSLTVLGWTIGLGLKELRFIKHTEKIFQWLPILSSVLIIVIGISLLLS
jgi:nickel/cobalt exporter